MRAAQPLLFRYINDMLPDGFVNAPVGRSLMASSQLFRMTLFAAVSVLAWGTGAQAQTQAGSMAPMPVVAAGKTPADPLPSADRFKSAAAAASHCPGDTVVWSTLSKGRSFHLPGTKRYGTTKHGAYVCEHDALAFGFHPAKS